MIAAVNVDIWADPPAAELGVRSLPDFVVSSMSDPRSIEDARATFEAELHRLGTSWPEYEREMARAWSRKVDAHYGIEATPPEHDDEPEGTFMSIQFNGEARGSYRTTAFPNQAKRSTTMR